MSDTTLLTGRDLAQAICSHFRLNPDLVHSDYRITSDADVPASVTLTILLTADDLAGIALAAGAKKPCAARFPERNVIGVHGKESGCEAIVGVRPELFCSSLTALKEEARSLRTQVEAITKNTARIARQGDRVEVEGLRVSAP